MCETPTTTTTTTITDTSQALALDGITFGAYNCLNVDAWSALSVASSTRSSTLLVHPL